MDAKKAASLVYSCEEDTMSRWQTLVVLGRAISILQENLQLI